MQTGTRSSVDSNVATLLLGSIGGTNALFELVDADISTGERVPGRSFSQVCILTAAVHFMVTVSRRQ